MKHHAKTTQGTIEETYENKEGETELAGSIQGCGNIMADWTFTSDTMLRPFVFIAKKINNYYLLNTPDNSRVPKRSIGMYVDAATTYTGIPSHKEYFPDVEIIQEQGGMFIHDAAETIAENLQTS